MIHLKILKNIHIHKRGKMKKDYFPPSQVAKYYFKLFFKILIYITIITIVVLLIKYNKEVLDLISNSSDYFK